MLQLPSGHTFSHFLGGKMLITWTKGNLSTFIINRAKKEKTRERGSEMILSVTMNPSVDISYPLKQFKLNEINRIEHVSKTAGGKGLNVTRVISQLEEDVLATGVIGGTLGDFINQELKKAGIKNDFLKTEKESRNCIAILHEGMQTEILESGPTLSLKEGKAFLDKFEGLLSKTSFVTISGSLPKGLPDDFYHQMLVISHKKDVPVILDSSGESLKQVLLHKEKPFAIKPNHTELSQLIGKEVNNDRNLLKEVLSHELFNDIECVMVSMGSKGALVKYKDRFYNAIIPKINVVNPVGSGDATVAGLAVSLNRGEPIETAIKASMTAGMLNTIEAGTGSVNLNHFMHYFNLVEINEIY